MNMETIIRDTPEAGSRESARIVAELIFEKPDVVLGLATGGTPLLLYQELIKIHRREGLDFSRVTTFNLDEYLGLPKEHEQSYHRFMQENLFQYINIRSENTHIPDGTATDISAHCQEYEKVIVDAGGIDLQILGIGSNGHIGFNEPTSSFASRTRRKTMARETVAANARFFGDDEAKVPRHCITMGIGTIMEAEQIVMLAFGENKAEAIAATVEGPVASVIPASILQHHRKAKIFLDRASSSKLQMTDYYFRAY